MDYSIDTFYFKYLLAYYYSIVTMITVGYGDIIPFSDESAIFTIVTMLILSGLFTFILTNISRIH